VEKIVRAISRSIDSVKELEELERREVEEVENTIVQATIYPLSGSIPTKPLLDPS
jgi:phosphopantothenate synthetase